jgi:hypothetical protein
MLHGCRRNATERVTRGTLMDARRVSAAAAAGLAAGYVAAHHFGRTWGATPDECARTLPGDDLVTGRRFQTTHAVTIDAPPDRVWPWLVQMGWGRAGWYTYRWVDRLLFPANGPSVDRIVPELQQLAEGDQVPDGPPETGCAFTVERLEAARTLLLFSDSHLFGSLAEREDVTMAWAWSWQLEELPAGRTRLIQRNNCQLSPPWLHRAYAATMIPADLVMARSHLRGIRARVEATP